MPSDLLTENENNFNHDMLSNLNISNIFLRRKKLIIVVSTAVFAAFGVGYLLAPPTWRGEFQIVVTQKEKPLNNRTSNGDRRTSFLENSGLNSLTRLNTEVKILESPSVLLPVFKFVKDEYIRNKIKPSGFSYLDWISKNVSVSLVRGTSVVKIFYEDKDKNLVENALKMISNEYQRFSARDRDIGLSRSIIHLDKQINLYKIKSQDSLKLAQEFGSKWDLIASNLDNALNNNVQYFSVNVEEKRLMYKNLINELNMFIKNPETLYLGSGEAVKTKKNVNDLELFSEELFSLYKDIKELDKNLALFSSKFKDNDIFIKQLKSRRKLLSKLLNEQTKEHLLFKLSNAKINLESTERPSGVVLKYKELVRQSIRDAVTLKSYENERQAVILDQSRESNPWDLISKPTVFDTRVSPSKRKYFIQAFMFSIIISSLLIYIAELIEGKVNSLATLKKLLPFKFLAEIETSKSSSPFLKLLFARYLRNSQSTAFLLLGSLNESVLIDHFKTNLLTFLQDKDFTITTNISETYEFDNCILVIKSGDISEKQILDFLKLYSLLDKQFCGWISIK